MAILIRDIFHDEHVVEQLDALYKSCSEYFQVRGMSLCWDAEDWTAEETLLQVQMDPDRRILGVFPVGSSELVGAVEVKLRYPSKDCVTIGSMLLRPAWRRKRVGTETLYEIERRAIRERGAMKLEIAVSEHENVALFLEKNGFQKTERRKLDRREAEPCEVTVWGKHLQAEE